MQYIFEPFTLKLGNQLTQNISFSIENKTNQIATMLVVSLQYETQSPYQNAKPLMTVMQSREAETIHRNQPGPDFTEIHESRNFSIFSVTPFNSEEGWQAP